MAIPDFQSVTLIETLADEQERTMRVLTDLLAVRFVPTEPECQGLLPSGQQSIFSNRVAWSKYKMGLEVVCIQSKWWVDRVGRPVIQGFIGSMDYIRARNGVIMTTSTVTKDGLDFVDRIEGKKVVLIDGGRLADLMIEHNLGVTTTKVYELKEVSNDFFDESEA